MSEPIKPAAWERLHPQNGWLPVDQSNVDHYFEQGQAIRRLYDIDPNEAASRIAELRQACARQNEEICQTLGKALGYPWFKDDQANFPGSTKEHGVCVGDHVAESIADEAAKRIAELEAENARLRRDDRIGTHSPDCWSLGPRHYDCATRRVAELEAKLATAVGALEEIIPISDPCRRIEVPRIKLDDVNAIARKALASIQERT